MNPDDGFDHIVSAWLHADAAHRVPDHLDAVLRRTRSERQRPAWSSLERWLPMQTTLRLTPVPRIAWLLALVVLTIALVGATLLVASRPRLPQPFGPARNGAIVSSHDGDIYALDPVTHAPRLLVGGDPLDFGPSYSRDGTKLMFLRSPASPTATSGLTLMIANSDGTGVHAASPEVQGLDWVDWSPDSRQVAFLSRPAGNGPGRINIVNVDGSGLTTLAVGRPANFVSWVPPNGGEILFRGEQLSSTDPATGLFAVHPDGTGLRPLTSRPASDGNDFGSPAVSPDGSLATYCDNAVIARIHVLDLRTGVDRILPDPDGFTSQRGLANFSPDGRLVGYVRYYTIDNTYQLVVAPSDGSGTGTPIGPRLPAPSGDINYAFTPDGSAIVAAYGNDGAARLLPVDGSEGSVLARGSNAFADIQRLAP